MPRLPIFFLFLLAGITSFAQPKSIQERLGYPKETKLLIIHADDLGVSHSENQATFTALEHGSVSSASIMVPCPWFPEIAAYATAHPEADFGLHLTLTSEWKYLKWGPVTPRNEVASLIDNKGFFYDDVASVGQHATAADVERELRGQVERAIQFGITPTHFDTHMGSIAAKPDFAKVYIRLGREYGVPVLLTRELAGALGLADFITDRDVMLDRVLIANPTDFKNGMTKFYEETLRSVPAGLSLLILHAAFDDAEMRAVTVDHPDYGAAWRQADFDFFTSEKSKTLIQDLKIQVVTWKEVKSKLSGK